MRRPVTFLLAGVLALGGLAACSDDDSAEVEQQVEEGVEQVEEGASELGEQVEDGASELGEQVEEATEN
jgi:outer membrane lipoprotein-sorting protein